MGLVTHSKLKSAPRTLVVGLGQTGLSCVRFLARQGVPVAVTDSRDNPPGLDVLHNELPDVPAFLGGFDQAAFAAADRLLVSPGVSLKEPLVAQAIVRGAQVIGDVALFAEYATAPVVGITGSNGKSTVTTLLGEMVKRSGQKVKVGGNIGIPALELLKSDSPDFYVLELSSFQLETAQQLALKAAVVLNISEDHMDRYQDVREYAAAKQAIFNRAEIKVINRDDSWVNAMVKGPQDVLSFGLSCPTDGEFGLLEQGEETYLARGRQPLLAVSEVCMAGRHNLMNALAALALGQAMGLPMTPMLEVLRNFGGLPHRCQRVGKCKGVSWYNDSKGTNVGAAAAAIEGLRGPLVLIAGGEGKGADFTPLAVAGKVKAAVLIGRDASLIQQALQGTIPCHIAKDMRDAVRQALALAAEGDSVLLSPACASFDMFSDYRQRGEVFMAAVEEMCDG